VWTGGKLTLLHLAEQLLVEHAAGLLVQRAVDGHDIALRQHVLEVLNSPATNLLLLLGSQTLVVKVQQLLAVEGLQPAEDALADTANSHGTDDLVLQVVLVLGDGRDVPVAGGDLLVGGDEVADQDEDSHDDVLSDGHHVGAGDLGNGDTAVGRVGSIQVDVVRTNTGRHGDLELLCLGEALLGEVAGVEAVMLVSALLQIEAWPKGLRCGNDDLSINKLLVKLAVLALLVGGRHKSVALVLNPLPDPELVLGRPEQSRLVLGVLVALRSSCQLREACQLAIEDSAYIVQHQEDLALLRCGR